MGTPNRKTLDLRKHLEARDISLIDEILDIALKFPERLRLDALMKLLPYVYPKYKTIQLEIGEKEPTNFVEWADQMRKKNAVVIRARQKELLAQGRVKPWEVPQDVLDEFESNK